MESGFAAQSVQLNKEAEEDEVGIGSANTIMLPETSITNGADNGVDNMEFLDEAEMQNDPMVEFNVLEEAEESISPSKVQLLNPEEHEDDEEEEEVNELQREEVDIPMTRTPTQVPKKRRDAAMLAAAAMGEDDEEEVEEEVEAEIEAEAEIEEEDGNDNDIEDSFIEERDISADDGHIALEHEIEEEDEVRADAATTATEDDEQDVPTSSARAASNKENSVDEEQCRVCTTKDDLVSLFKKVETLTVAEMLMIICPSVSIARKDFMPQYICNTCLDNVTIAVQLKNQCETTEKELRKKLSRSKNKVRRPTGYVVIDAPIDSDPPSEEEPKDDMEFKVSDVEISASGDEDSSEDSDFGSVKKKRIGRGGGGRRGRRKSAVTPTFKSKEKKRIGRPPVRKHDVNESSEDDLGGSTSPPKKKKKKNIDKDTADKPTEFPCDECDQVFTRKLSLVLHKKAHSSAREPINCEVCGKQFKIQGAYRSHLEKHKEDYPTPHQCHKCSKSFMTKADLRKHIADVHDDISVFFTCDKCKRVFTTQQRLNRHKESRCPGYEVKQPRKSDLDGLSSGKDLFKSVAPLTTTYWSDSFSD